VENFAVDYAAFHAAGAARLAADAGALAEALADGPALALLRARGAEVAAAGTTGLAREADRLVALMERAQ
jgi:hypothetical protein